jgi:CHAT domain-containing protein
MQLFQVNLRFLLLCIVVMVASCTLNSAVPAPEEQADTFMNEGLNQFKRGHFEMALENWQQAANFYAQSKKINLYINVLLKLAEGYQRLGHYQKAESKLQMALQQAQNSHDEKQKAKVLGSLGQLGYVMGKLKKAQTYLNESIQLAQQTQQGLLQAWGLLHLGQIFAAQQDYQTAQTKFRQSIQLAQHQPGLALKGLMNQIRVWLQMGNTQKAATQLASLWSQLQQLPENHEKAYLLLKLSELVGQLKAAKINFGLQAQFLNAALRTAKAINDQYSFSQANGALGSLYKQANQYDNALRLTRLARIAAEQVDAKRLLYRWEWQIGKLLNAQGKIEPAIIAYQSAKNALDKLKSVPQEPQNACQTPMHYPDFKNEIEPFLLEWADLLLQHAKLVDYKRQQKIRDDARQVIESLKEKEIQDYFESQCATKLLGKSRKIDEIGENTAVLYPIILENRIELLLSLPSKKIEQFSQAVTKTQIKETVTRLRTELKTNWLESDYLKDAQQLYQWLIEPIVSTLEKEQVTTLVVVPEHYLRTIPLSVLYDNEKQEFLVQQYALAITTGVTLTAPNANTLANKNIPVLSSGLTQVIPGIKAQRFKALRLAETELEEIQAYYPNQKSLTGTNFTIENLYQNLKNAPSQLLHISSHAQFTSDSKRAFIVTYNDFLTLDKLENIIKTSKYRKDNPLELLTLNACETATGDERAALGLSGIALKAGARSAVATLWPVYDDAATNFTLEFYKHLKSGLSKAQALQKVQKIFLTPQSKYKHPHYWAAFILIGNWL